MSLVQTYEAVIQVLARQGNELAQQTLEAVVNVDSGPNLGAVANYNREAIGYLSQALVFVADEDTASAIDRIQSAIEYISRATTNLVGDSMCKTLIYEAALQQMAADGNEQAKLVLTIAQSAQDLDITKAAEHMQAAITKLQAAMQSNSIKWTMDTDRSISSAIGSITTALRSLIR